MLVGGVLAVLWIPISVVLVHSTAGRLGRIGYPATALHWASGATLLGLLL